MVVKVITGSAGDYLDLKIIGSFGQVFFRFGFIGLLPPVPHPLVHLLFVPLLTGSIKSLTFKRLGQVLLLHKMLGVVMGIFIIFAIPHFLHERRYRIAEVQGDRFLGALMNLLLHLGIGFIKGVTLGGGG